MPAVPPTYISCDSGSDNILPTVDVIPEGQYSPTGPTPDPDLDDCVQVPGDALGAVTVSFLIFFHSLIKTHTNTAVSLQDKHRAQDGSSPHICLTNLSLHSPPSFVGTPFDVSPRFEYPFPPAPSEHDSAVNLPLFSHFAPIPPSVYVHHAFASSPSHSTPPPPQPFNNYRPERASSPTHPKLVSRDPPVPPSLVAKKKSNGSSKEFSLKSPLFTRRQRKRSRSTTPERGQDREAAKTKRTNSSRQERLAAGGRPSVLESKLESAV